jgi:multiple sugar transport system substrate-binding protein
MKSVKQLGILMIALMIMVQLGCSSNSNGSDTTPGASTGSGTDSGKSGASQKLVFWDFHSTGNEGKFFEEQVAAYNKVQSNVNIEYVAVNQADYQTTKLPTAFANGEAPDIFFVEPATFMKYAKSGVLADLTKYFPEGVMADFQPSFIEAVKYDNQILALPFESDLLGLYYNKDMLKNAGVAVPKTWDELKAAAKKLNTGKVAGLVLPTDKGPYTNFNFYPFLWQAGGDVLSKDETKSAFNSPAAAKALDFWGSFFKDGVAPTKLQLGPWDIGNLGTGTTAMQVMGTWGISDVETKYKDMPIDVAPLPYPSDGKAVTVAGGQKMAVNAKSKNVDESAKFIMWLFGDKDTTRAVKWATEAKFAYPARKSVIDANKEIYSKGLRKTFTEQIFPSAIPEPRLAGEVVDIIGDTLQKVSFNNISGADAAKETDDAINAALKN